MPALSPRTMAFSGGPPSADQAKPLFEQGLTQMAYDVLISKLPNISPDVVTFKIIHTDPDAGSGAGAFVVRRQGQSLYVPVIMADNQIKPLDVFYHKSLNVFLPLTKEWLEQIDRASLTEMGRGAKPPPSMSKDVDIRQVVVPPVTGRFSYASDRSAEKTAAMVFDQARSTKPSTRPVFLEFLSLAPNRVKKAAALVFESRPKLLKAAVRTYGATKFSSAFREMPEKLADYGGRLSRGGALYVLDDNASADLFRDVFGPGAPLAYQDAVTKGYAGKDTRETKRALRTTHPMIWTEPDAPGAYKFVGVDGRPALALAFPATVSLFHRFKYDSRGSSTRRMGDHRFDDNGLAITDDGTCVIGKLPVAEKLELGAIRGSRLLRELAVGEPRVGEKGVFVRLDSRGMSATEPVKVKSVATDSRGVRRVVVTQPEYGYTERELLTLPDSDHTPLVLPADERIGQLPSAFKFISFSKEDRHGETFLKDDRTIQRLVTDELYKSAGEKHTVRFSSSHGWTLNSGNRAGLKLAAAVDVVARETGVHVDVAASLVKEAAENGRVEFWAIPEAGARRVERFLKMAAGQAQPQGQQAQPDPSQMPPPPPPMPSPVDMAVAEQTQSIMGQMQALQQQLTMLQMVQQRSQQIATGGAGAAPEAMAAAMGGPTPMGPQGVNPALAGPGPQMSPDQMQQGMPQQGMPQQGMPQQGMPQQGMPQQGMPGGDPNQPQIDPQTGQPMEQPPPAMMSNDPGTPEEIASQVNPQFMEQAADLQDDGAFDAAALASMAQSPSVRDLIAAYVPNLERALDNLGRIMITLYLDESRIKEQVGNETFVALEDNLRNTFKGLGDLLLKVNQNAVTMQTASPFSNTIQ